jgi:hypothetical protein
VATPHSIKLILHVPLKSKEQSFTLYKIIILPERVSFGKFMQYSVDDAYFGLNINQRDYILLTEAQFNYCTKGSIYTSEQSHSNADKQGVIFTAYAMQKAK